jgi:hypothetical protein
LGVPGTFRRWCETAARDGKSDAYRRVGRRFGQKLLEYVPHNLSDDEWLTTVQRMEATVLEGGADWQGLAAWLHRHFPLMMRLIPKDRFESFLQGLKESHDTGEMMEQFPEGFEPVDVNLDDPCEGDGYVRIVYHKPVPREVLYQCPAPRCRERSQAIVEGHAAARNLPIIRVGETIATVEEIARKAPES